MLRDWHDVGGAISCIIFMHNSGNKKKNEVMMCGLGVNTIVHKMVGLSYLDQSLDLLLLVG